MVADGALHVKGLPIQPFATTAPPGPAVALLRQHHLALLPGAGEARVVSVRHVGPLLHYVIEARQRTLEVVSTSANALRAGDRCGLAIKEAQVFAAQAGPTGEG